MPGQSGGLRGCVAVQMPDVGHVGIELARRQSVACVRCVAIAELQGLRIGGDPVPDNVVGEHRAAREVRGEILTRSRQPGIEEVLLCPRIGAEYIAECRRGSAAVVSAGLLAILEQLGILIAAPYKPLIDQFSFYAGAVSRTADEPEAVPHAVKTGVVSGHVLSVDRRFGLDHLVNDPDEPRNVASALGFTKIVVQPVPGQGGVNTGGRVPVDRCLLLETNLVEAQTSLKAFPGKLQILLVAGHSKNKCSPRGLGPKLSGFDLTAQLCLESIDAALDIRVPLALGAQSALSNSGPCIGVEEESWVVTADFRSPVRKLPANDGR